MYLCQEYNELMLLLSDATPFSNCRVPTTPENSVPAESCLNGLLQQAHAAGQGGGRTGGACPRAGGEAQLQGRGVEGGASGPRGGVECGMGGESEGSQGPAERGVCVCVCAGELILSWMYTLSKVLQL